MSKFRIYLTLLLLIFTITSCDRVIDPFEKNIGTYSVYGSLDIDDKQHAIRVKNVSVPFLADSSIGYDGLKVYFQYPDNKSIQLQDTIINFNGNYTYNYLLKDQLQPATEYSLKLIFDEDQEAYSTISTPGITIPDSIPERLNSCYQVVRIFFENVKNPEFINADVGVIYQGQMQWAKIGRVDKIDYVSDTNRMEVRLSVTNLLVDLFPPPPEATVGIPPRFWLPTVNCNELDQFTMFFRYIHFGKEWKDFRGTEFLDLDFLDSGDIQNGVGFIGAIRQGEFSFDFELD